MSLDDVLAAREVLAGVLTPTPMEFSQALTDRTGVPVHLKCENLQRAGSFKMRGAYTRMSRLTEQEKRRGVVAASAGNHAQGVAFACARSGVHARIYLPRTTPRQKRDRVAALGGRENAFTSRDLTGYFQVAFLIAALIALVGIGFWTIIIRRIEPLDWGSGHRACGKAANRIQPAL